MDTISNKELIDFLRFYSPTLDGEDSSDGLPLAVSATACKRTEALRLNDTDVSGSQSIGLGGVVRASEGNKTLTTDTDDRPVPPFENEWTKTCTDPQKNFQISEKITSLSNSSIVVSEGEFDVWLKRAEELLFPKKAIYMAHTSLVNPTPPTGKLELVPTDADIKRHNEDTYLDDIASNICPLDHGFMMDNVLTDVERLAVNYQLAFAHKKIGRATPRFNELKQQMLDIT